jgi:cyclopropane-fatty-acyl-phospholipid synthase
MGFNKGKWLARVFGIRGFALIMNAHLVKTSSGNQDGVDLFRKIVADFHPRDFDVRFWDGSTLKAEVDGAPKFTLVLNHPAALRSMVSDPVDLALGEAYIWGDLDVEGDLESAFRLADHLSGRNWKLFRGVDLLRRLAHLGSRISSGASHLHRLRGVKHSESRDREAVTYHYNLSNDFFALWLDPGMVYSCAYFASPDNDLAQAQQNKLDLICHRLKLQPGERFLDIGCGWGGLLIHAVQNYRVSATGITLSEPQARLARDRASQAGLSADECEVLVLDYRELDRPACYDKVASVGMVEHVGRSQLSGYFEQVLRLLKPGGMFLNQGISSSRYAERFIRQEFLKRYVFPDAEMEPVDVLLHLAEQAGFEIRLVESLREHYVLTLRAWGKNLEASDEQARRLVGDVNYRIWKLYLAASAYSFEKGNHSVFQSLLVKANQ